MPCKNAIRSRNSNYNDIVIDMFTSTADHLASINANHIILGGDFNADFRFESDVTKFLLDMLKHIQVIDCCLTLNTSSHNNYTFENSLGHTSWIDWFFVSESVVPNILSFNIGPN